MLHFGITINIVLFQYIKKMMQNYNQKKLRVHSRGDNQIWSYLVLQHTLYLFNVNYFGFILFCTSHLLNMVQPHLKKLLASLTQKKNKKSCLALQITSSTTNQ